MRVARRLAPLASSPVAIVGAIVLVCFAMTTHYALRVDDWRVMTDELLYVKLARSIADGLSPIPEVNGEYMAVFSQLFPLLFAPFAGLLSAPAAYEAGHVLNAFLMASTAIPVYLLVRAVGLPRLAGYLTAAVTVSVPWLGMATILWTEAVGYPAFAWAILVVHRAVVASGVRNDLLALGGLVLAFVARTQFIFLVAVLPLAILIHEAGYGARTRSAKETMHIVGRTARSHRVLLVAYAVIAAGAVLLGATRGLDAALGTYSATATGKIWPSGAWTQMWKHAASVTVATGVVPTILAVGWAVDSVFRPSRRELHAFAVIFVLVVPALLVIVGSFTARFSPGYLQDRYLFYAVPVLAVGMAACLLDPRRRWIAVAAAGIGFFFVADFVTYEAEQRTLWFASPSTWFWKVLDGRSDQLGAAFGIDALSPRTVVEVGTLMATAALATLLRWRPPGPALLVGVTLPVVVFCFLETNYVLEKGSQAAGGGNSITGGIALGDRNWVDDALPPDGAAALLPTYVGDDTPTSQRTWWSVEFWNKHITRQVVATEGSYTPFPRQEMSIDFATGRVEVEGDEPRYLVVSQTERRFRLDTEQRLAEGFGVLELIEPVRPYRATWTSDEIGPDGWTHAEPVHIRLHHDVSGQQEARRVTLTVTVTAELKSQDYRLTGGVRKESGVVLPAEAHEIQVNACLSPGRSTELELDVGRYRKLKDGRLVGLRVLDIDATPVSPAVCRDTHRA